MTQATPEIRYATIADRKVAVTKATETQAVLISREGILLQKAGIDRDRLVRGMIRVLDAIESLIVNEDDKEWITDQMLVGKLELTDLLEIVKAFKDDAPQVPAQPTVRRGRPPKKRD